MLSMNQQVSIDSNVRCKNNENRFFIKNFQFLYLHLQKLIQLIDTIKLAI